MSIEIYCLDEENRELCFTHAIRLIIEQKVKIHLETEDEDPGESQIMRIHQCYICEQS